jgi:VWFA-related protein
MKRFEVIVIFACLWLIGLGLASMGAKEKKPPPGQEPKINENSGNFSLKVPVDVVVVSAAATDGHGSEVKDLTIKDFRLYEDGKPMMIHTFGTESYLTSQPAEQAKTGDMTAAPGKMVQEHDHFIALMIDDLNSPTYQSLYSVVEAIKKYIAKDVQPGNQISVTSTSGRIQIPFTNDTEQLRRQLATVLNNLDRRPILQPSCAELTESQAIVIQAFLSPGSIPHPNGSSPTDVSAYLQAGGCRLNQLPPEIQVAIAEKIACEHLETGMMAVQAAASGMATAVAGFVPESEFRHRLMLKTLRQYIRSLRHFEGRKSLVLLSEGFISRSVRYELQEVVDLALRSDVNVSTVDIRGLYVLGPTAENRVSYSASGEIENRIPSTAGIVIERVPISNFMSLKMQVLSNQQSEQAAPLAQLASETGGLFFHNNNDIFAGIQRVSEHQEFSYILTYASPDPKNDGRYHKIKLEVTRPGVRLKYRQGYFAPREQVSTEKRKKEDIIEALRAPGNLNEIPLQFSYKFYQITDSEYQITLSTRVNVSRLEFQREDARHRNSLSLVVAAFDENNRWIDGLEKVIDFNLTDPSYAALVQYGFSSDVNFKLPPGRYRVRTVVRDGLKSRMGSFNRLIEIP